MPNSPHIHDHDSKCDHNHDSNDVGQRDVVDPNVDVMSPRQAELADRRTVALGSAPFVPYGRNLDRPTVGRRDDAVVFGKAIEARVVEASETLHVCLPLQTEWNYYYHLPNDKNWNLASYKPIMSNISTLEQLIGLNEMVTDNIIKNCMLFIMRKGITPMWEDACNRQGGSFSYKVVNKMVVQVWRKLMYLLCGYSLTIDPSHMDLVNGITISPKRGFCIVKIWMKNCTLQDPAVITNIDNLLRNGCLFKSHNPEF